MEWEDIDGIIHTAEFGHLLLIVRKCDAGHWTWYVIDDEDQELDASGSDETEEAAIANCEIAAFRQDERDDQIKQRQHPAAPKEDAKIELNSGDMEAW